MADLCSRRASVMHTLSSHAKGAQQFSCCLQSGKARGFSLGTAQPLPCLPGLYSLLS